MKNMKNMKLQILLSAIVAMALTSSAATIYWTGNEDRWGGGSLTATANDNFSTTAGGTTYQKVSANEAYEHVYDESAMAGASFAVSMNRANNTINSLTISGNTGFTFTPNVIDLKLGGPVTVSGGIHTFDNKGVYNMTVTANTTWDIAADSRLIWKINLSEASAGLGITKTGDGQLIMRGGMTNSITGDLAINGGSFGGAATLNGNLGFAAGTKLIFNDSYTLTMANGTASFDSFDIADLVNLDSSVSNATYTLISGNVDSTNIGNIGLDNAADIGAGKSAYFLENGGLQLVVIPEPATLSMLTFATLGLLAVRRLRK